jgi:hypothetical protein
VGKLCDAAKARALKGAVTVTDERGMTVTYPNEATAEAAVKDKTVEHRRGAFFIVASEAASDVGSKGISKKSK